MSQQTWDDAKFLQAVGVEPFESESCTGTLADLGDLIVESLLSLPVEEQKQFRKDMLAQITKNRLDKAFIQEVARSLIREDFDLDCYELARAFDIFLRLIERYPSEFNDIIESIPGRPWKWVSDEDYENL